MPFRDTSTCKIQTKSIVLHAILTELELHHTWHSLGLMREYVHAARHPPIFQGPSKNTVRQGCIEKNTAESIGGRAYRDLAAAFHDPQERVKQASQGFTICILTVAGKQSHKALHSVLLPEAGLNATWVLTQPGCQCIQSRALPHLHSNAQRCPPASQLHAASMHMHMLYTC